MVAGGGGLAQDGGAVGAQGGEDDGGLDLGAGDGDVELGAVEMAGGEGQGGVGAVGAAVDAGAEGAQGAHDAVHGAGAQGGVAGEDGVERPPGQQAGGEAHGGAAVGAVEDVGGFAEAVEADACDAQFVRVHGDFSAESSDEGGAGAGVGAKAGVAQAGLAVGLGAEEQAAVSDGLVAGDPKLAAQAARRFDDHGARRGGSVDHAPTGAPTGRPRAAAIGSNWAISSLKCLKLRLCWPSIRADSGSGWTSTMMPSAPAATEARAIGWTMYQCPVPCDGSTMIGRWVRRRSRGMALRSRVKREEVSKVRMPRSQSMTSGVAAGQDVLGAHEPLVDGVAHAALEQDGFLAGADLAEERVVLGVAGADLQDVGVIDDELDLAGIQDLGNDGQAGGFAGLGQELEARFAHALEAVGGAARLVGAAAQHPGAGAGHVGGGGSHLLGALDGAGAGHDGDGAVADFDAADLDDGALAGVGAGGELEGLADGDGGLDMGHAFELLEQLGRAGANDGDHGLVHAGEDAGFQALGVDAGCDRVQGRLAGAVLHHDDHRAGS